MTMLVQSIDHHWDENRFQSMKRPARQIELEDGSLVTKVDASGNQRNKPHTPESTAVSHLTGLNETIELRDDFRGIALLNCQLRFADQVQPRIHKGIQDFKGVVV
jgi:hypothetical protein